jgi:exosortase
MSSASTVATLSGTRERHAWRTEWIVLGALLLLAFLPVLRWMYERWIAADSYTSHGFLVPLVSAYFVYQQRAQLMRETRRPSAWGLVLVGCALAIFCVSGLLRVYFTSGSALVLCLTGMLAYWGGWHWVRRLWFPLFFLVFMLPLPEVAIARANLWLKLVVARAAVAGVEAVGIPIVMNGARLQLQNAELIVGDVCSGLRSIIALIALGVLYAHTYGGKGWMVRSALLSAVLPAAVVANVLRIFLNVVFVHFFGKEFLFSPLFSLPFVGEIDLHLLSGFLVFVFALMGLQLTLLFVEEIVRRRKRSAR